MAPPMPTELIELILAAVGDDEKVTFANCCLASRTFYRAAVPYLYRRLGCTKPNAVRKTRLLNLIKQCHSLSQNRALTRYVLEIEQALGNDPARHEPDPTAQFDLRSLHHVFDGLDVPSTVKNVLVKESDGRLRFTEESAVVVLAILCPQVKSIRFICNRELRGVEWMRDFVHVVRNGPICQSRESHNVEEVHFVAGHDLDGTTSEETRCNLGWPRLCRLSVSGLKQLSKETPENSTYYLWKYLDGLKFDICAPGRDSLVGTLERCSRLTRLDVEWISDREAMQVDWPEFSGVLSTSLLYLEHLRLEYSRPGTMGIHERQKADAKMCMSAIVGIKRVSGIMALTELRLLKTLVIPSFALAGKRLKSKSNRPSYGEPSSKIDELLPDCLKELTVICQDHDTDCDVERFLHDPVAIRLRNFTVIDFDNKPRCPLIG